MSATASAPCERAAHAIASARSRRHSRASSSRCAATASNATRSCSSTHEVYYIGESHTRRLFETLTRHLYSWSGFGSGPSYNPERVEVAWLETTAEDARYQQYELIMHFRPLDNQKDGRSLFTDAAPLDEEVPF